eukprot:1682458-Rhodomonas_salina.1
MGGEGGLEGGLRRARRRVSERARRGRDWGREGAHARGEGGREEREEGGCRTSPRSNSVNVQRVVVQRR